MCAEMDSDEFGPLLEDVTQYTRLVGKLIYQIVTRPHITYAVGLVHKPKKVFWKAILRILTYIKGYLGKGLLYKKNRHLWVEAFFNSSYAEDKKDRKSTSGYCTYVGGNLVTWRSKSRRLYLVLVRRLSIELWLILLVR